jgi:hypothetical protein
MRVRFSPEEKRLVDYLLGRLNEAERQDMTERMLADDEVFSAVVAAEELLIDEYARGHLDPEEARLVEATLLTTPEGRGKLRTAKALLHREAMERARQNRSKWLAAAAVVVIACGAGFGVSVARRPSVVQSPVVSPAIVLGPNTYRGDDSVPVVPLPITGGPVAFSVPLAPADRAPRYEIHMRTAEHPEVTAEARDSGDGVRIEVPRSALAAARYEVEVFGVTDSGKKLIAFGTVEFR